MAKQDVLSLEAEGIHPTFEELIKLNALGVRCESNPDSLAFYALPRCAFLQSKDDVLTLREPTVGQDIWLQNALRLFDDDDETTLFILRTMSMTMDYDLPPWSDPNRVVDAVKDFLNNRLNGLSARQIITATNYCMFGCDPNSDEQPIMSDGSDDGMKDKNDSAMSELDKDNRPELSMTIGVIHKAQALGLGIPLCDMCKMTPSELQSVVDEAMAKGGVDRGKESHDKFVVEYYATLDAIRKRHKDEGKA